MYLSYLYLFVDFFYNAYIVRKPVRGVATEHKITDLPEKKTMLPAVSSSSKKTV